MRRFLAAAIFLLTCGPVPALPALPVPTTELHLFPAERGDASVPDLTTALRVAADDAEGEPALSTPRTEGDAAALKRRLNADLRAIAHPPYALSSGGWRALGYGTLAVVAAAGIDGSVRDAVQDRSTAGSVRFAKAVRPLGREGGLALLGAGWAAGRLLDRPRLTLMAEDGLEATLLAAGLLVPAIKEISGRARPNAERDSSSFAPFSSRQSFPSGEATEVFAIAAVVSGHSEARWAKGLAWGLATTVALQRIELDAHWASDVVAGALLGAGVGRWVTRRHRGELAGKPSFDLTPGLGRGRCSLDVRVAW